MRTARAVAFGPGEKSSIMCPEFLRGYEHSNTTALKKRDESPKAVLPAAPAKIRLAQLPISVISAHIRQGGSQFHSGLILDFKHPPPIRCGVTH